uniref:Uncharacterized protein LOC113799329 n=1 Tax=Dermatophagoides pteronyssinus TaxID=6956 RepID=A0A6P6YKH1_DERPT|nr:uncharacterized protein LOC113799329 [Dermatophagoides pteronyssinus]
MVSTKHQLINNNCIDSNDCLSNRVQNLLEKTLICQKFKPSICNQDVFIQQKQQQQNIVSSTNKSGIPQESNVILNNYNTEISESITNLDQFDDLTEYYPIQKFHRNTITIRENESSMIDNSHLSDIILFHKNFLNSQINHLKRLNYDLIRIEKYLQSKSDANNYSLRNCHCHHGNNVDRILNAQQKIHSFTSYEQQKQQQQCYDNLDTTKLFSKHERQTKILQTSISMIQKINRQINKQNMANDNDYDDDMTNKSVQTSFVFVEKTVKHDDNFECPNLNRSLSWFLYFVDDENYRIYDTQSFNLSEIFEQKQHRFIHRSLMRSLRIKDNGRLRIETAQQRKDEIVQVFLLTKSHNTNDECLKQKSSTSRPLPPINRRVFTHQQMRKQTEKLYRKLPESKNCRKNEQRFNEDDAKKRRMMAQIFKQKLKDNAVRGRLNWPITSQAISA